MTKPRTKPAAPQPATALRMIALADLTLSPLNSRQMVDPDEIAAMADSLAAVGLLQNLIGFETAEGRVEIVGGGKRLRALQRMAGDGWQRHGVSLAPIDPVPVLVTADQDSAVAWSGTENTARTPLHPADEIRAYGAMRTKGASPDLIARTFAVTGAHVTRRLALANLPDPVIDALRQGKISFDVAKALTMAPDADRAVEALDIAIQRDWNYTQTCRHFTQNAVSARDRRVIFVGLDALAGAGLQRDLFTDAAYVSDIAALDRLFVAKGIELAKQADAEGWSWAIFTPGMAYELKTTGLTPLYPEQIDLPPGDIERYDQLTDLAEAGHASDAEALELEALEDRMTPVFSDAQRATGGVYITIKYDGTPQHHAFAKAQTAPDSADDTGAGGDGITSKTLPAKAPPQNLIDDLAKIKLISLQTALLANPAVMLDLLGYQMTQDIAPWHRPLGLSTNPPAITPEKPDGTTISPRLVPDNNLRGDPVSLAGFSAYLALPLADRLAQLGVALARLFHDTRSDLAAGLAGTTGANARQVWSPTATGYFARLSGPAQDAIYTDLTPADKADHAAFRKLKGKDKAKTLEALFADASVREAMGLSRAEATRIDTWLPAELQWSAPDPGPADDEADEVAEDVAEEEAA